MDPTNVNVVYAAFGNSKSASTGMYLSSILPLTFNMNYIIAIYIYIYIVLYMFWFVYIFFV